MDQIPTCLRREPNCHRARQEMIVIHFIRPNINLLSKPLPDHKMWAFSLSWITLCRIKKMACFCQPPTSHETTLLSSFSSTCFLIRTSFYLLDRNDCSSSCFCWHFFSLTSLALASPKNHHHFLPPISFCWIEGHVVV